MKRRTVEEAPAEEKSEPLHIKYRPRDFAAVMGQGAAVKSLKSALAAKALPHVFLFTGPAGTGKTTLARIVASELGCPAASIVEHDAARNSGIDNMREITEGLRYQGFGASPNKAIILNECQGLSKQAWDALLEETEQPPPHVFFFFTSTNPEKIPKAMLTRALGYPLRSLARDDVLDLLDYVCKEEGLRTPGKILDQVADACDGSARGALTMLAVVQDVTDPEEAADLLRQPLDNAEVIELARLLLKRDLTWAKLCSTIKAVGDATPPETVRIILTAYFSSVALGARDERDAIRALELLDCFSEPCNPTDKWAPILRAFGRYIFD
ncbi:DNA polymerase III subunit tau [compost metagenome]